MLCLLAALSWSLPQEQFTRWFSQFCPCNVDRFLKKHNTANFLTLQSIKNHKQIIILKLALSHKYHQQVTQELVAASVARAFNLSIMPANPRGFVLTKNDTRLAWSAGAMRIVNSKIKWGPGYAELWGQKEGFIAGVALTFLKVSTMGKGSVLSTQKSWSDFAELLFFDSILGTCDRKPINCHFSGVKPVALDNGCIWGEENFHMEVFEGFHTNQIVRKCFKKLFSDGMIDEMVLETERRSVELLSMQVHLLSSKVYDFLRNDPYVQLKEDYALNNESDDKINTMLGRGFTSKFNRITLTKNFSHCVPQRKGGVYSPGVLSRLLACVVSSRFAVLKLGRPSLLEPKSTSVSSWPS